jgi:hypothetical protein
MGFVKNPNRMNCISYIKRLIIIGSAAPLQVTDKIEGASSSKIVQNVSDIPLDSNNLQMLTSLVWLATQMTLESAEIDVATVAK